MSVTTVFAVYDGMTHLDFTGPHQVLSRIPRATTLVASRDGGEIHADGLAFTDVHRLADIEHCDILCVPGGVNALKVAQDEIFLAELRRLSSGARYLTSVCTGSLILAAAGLLKGKRAACHWAWRHHLADLGAIPDDARVVRDGNIFTGGGVTAGIDFAFTLLEEICGHDIAETIELGLEYAPEPPFMSGRPELARPEILERYERVVASTRQERAEDVSRIAARLASTN
ncbi:MAG: DJ-1/PfpI family protein [Hyphomonadaceae bacterium]